MSSLRTIAGNLGLSVTTVSRGLAGYGDVAPATRQRIIDEANRLGYVPNEVARRLQRQQAGIIGMVLVTGTFENDPHFNAIALAASEELNARGYDLIMASARDLDQVRSVYIRLMTSRRVDGFLAFSVHCSEDVYAYVRDNEVPFVALGGGTIELASHKKLDSGLAAGTRMALDLLHAHGHRRICYLTLPVSNPFVTQQRSYLIARARDMGIDLTLMPCPLDEGGGQACARRLISGELDATAVLTPTGRSCVGIAIELQRAGVVVGRDVSLVTLGAHPLLDHLEPGITSVSPHTPSLVRQWVDLVMAQCRHDAEIPSFAQIQPEIVHRASVGPAPRRTLNTSA